MIPDDPVKALQLILKLTEVRTCLPTLQRRLLGAIEKIARPFEGKRNG